MRKHSSISTGSRRRLSPRLLVLMLAGASLIGCQDTREQLLSDGYPPEYADGFAAGCSSGRQAAGALAQFHKDVQRYLAQPLYAEGWRDGYGQCRAIRNSEDGLAAWHEGSLARQRDRDWQRHADQARARAFYP
jgi:hypothetical protein